MGVYLCRIHPNYIKNESNINLYKNFNNLPILWINSYGVITNNYLENEYLKFDFSKFNLDKTKLTYWREKFVVSDN